MAQPQKSPKSVFSIFSRRQPKAETPKAAAPAPAAPKP
jgi:hypothetical protein